MPPRALRSVLVALLALPAGAAQSSSGACALPAGLREAVQQRFGSARVFQASDLFEDERALFNAEHPGACPGLVQGQFFGAKERPATALLLVDVQPKGNLRLVVARPALKTWTFQEVDELDKGSTPVVSKNRGSGKDTVVLTGYESWQRTFVWNGRAFERLPTTP
jgi:hypothetical protein